MKRSREMEQQIHFLWPAIIDASPSWFTLKEMKCLSVICWEFFHLIKRYIEVGFPFRIPEDYVLLYYTPKKVLACPHSNIPPSATKITFNAPNRSILSLSRKCSKCILQSNLPLPCLLPSHLNELVLQDFSFPLPLLPATLTHLTLGPTFNHSVLDLPPNLVELRFSDSFNQPLNALPSSLLLLQFGKSFDQPLENLPPGLLQLILGTSFNKPLTSLPSSLLRLKFCNNSQFNHSIDNLPPQLVSLSLSRAFNRFIDKLPSSLTCLSFDPNSNPTISELPPSLTRLFISDTNIVSPFACFSSPFWPSTLKKLDLVKFKSTDFDNIPKSLTHLSLFYETEHPVYPDAMLFPSLKHLELHGDLASLPILSTFTSLTSLVMHHSSEPPLSYPPSLLTLTFCGSVVHPIDNLPLTITTLQLNPRFNLPLDHLPPSLTHLTLMDAFNQPLNHLPLGLRHLSLRSSLFNHVIDFLPPSLTYLSFSDSFNHNLFYLPSSLIYLRLGKEFSRSLDFLPQSLATLSIHYESLKKKGISLDHLPTFVHVIDEN